jgi:hypothetical protein
MSSQPNIFPPVSAATIFGTSWIRVSGKYRDSALG